jgi:hypothetical protein
MKNLFLACIAFLGFAVSSSAQQSTTKTPKTAKTETVLKKDGTPDKRFKKTEKPKVALKKDGTPDRRYKATK